MGLHSVEYDWSCKFHPSLPNVMKWDERRNRIAGDLRAYVDDLRAIGWSLEHAWQIARRVASRLQYLGIQDAARKRRVDNGPWAGSMFIASESIVQKTVTQEKWDKGKVYILDLCNLLENNPSALLPYKHLEKVRGFLCHLAMTFEVLFPYLKGFHLTLCSHLPKRDADGWKMKELEWIGYLEEEKESGKISDKEMDVILSQQFNNPIRS